MKPTVKGLLESLIFDYGIYLFQLAYSALLNPKLAEEAVIAICLQALQKTTKFKPTSGSEDGFYSFAAVTQ